MKYIKEPSPEKVTPYKALNALEIKKSGDFDSQKLANEKRRGLFSSNEKISGKM